MTDIIRDIVERWRQEAEILRRRGASSNAETLDSCAAELHAVFYEWELEALLVRDAAAETGKSVSQLRRDVQHGKLENVSASGPIRVRRRDVLERNQSTAT